MNLSEFKIGQRIAFAVGLPLILMLVLSATAITKLSSLNEDTSTLVNDRLPKVDRAADWSISLLQSARHSRNLLILDGTMELEKEMAALRQERQARATLIQWLEEHVVSQAAKDNLAALKDLRAHYNPSEDKFVTLVEAGAMGDAKAELLNETRPLQLAYLKGVDAFRETQRNHAKEQGASAAATYSGALTVLLGLSGLALAIGGAIGFAITRSITRQLGGEPAYAAAAARRIADGDLASDVTVRPGDTTSMLATMKAMRDRLVDIVGQVRQSSDSIATGSGQIASGNADLSQRTEEQASNLQQTSASMEQLTATVKDNADTARQASQLANSASAAATQGGLAVGAVVSTMEAITASSKKISDIISVIDGIAFQTNILALNAAVEAARAGEQGRGFAVVASEVRSLAQRSAAAAKEIKELITHSVETVDAGSRQVGEAGRTMTNIVSEVKRVSDLISEITVATEEQTRGITQVGSAVTQLDQVTQQNAALVEESAAAADSLSQQAAKLVEAVSVFRLDGAHSARSGHAGQAPAVRRIALKLASKPAHGARPAPHARQAPAPAASRDATTWESF